MNKVTLIGRLGKDPELKQISPDTLVCTFSLATTERYIKNGQKQQKVTWHNCQAWGKRGEILAKYLKKGFPLALEGQITNRKYEDQNGVERLVTEINVSNFEFIHTQSQTEESDSSLGDFDEIPF